MQAELVQMATADEILAQHAEQDFEEGLAHARERIRDAHGRFSGAALEALVVGAVTTLGMRSRMRADVRQLVSLAHRAANGEDPRKLGEEHLDHILRLKTKMGLIAREDDPRFQEIRKLALAMFEARLPDLARMANVKEAEDYGDLVRQAFPQRAYVDAMVEDNARRVGTMIAHLEANPEVLRVPQNLVPKISAMAREFIAWKTREVKLGVNAIYGKRS